MKNLQNKVSNRKLLALFFSFVFIFLLVPSVSASVLKDEVTHYYNFDETNGTTAFDSHSDLDGTANDSSIFNNSKNGKIKTGAYFNGSQYINYSESWLNNNANFTISFWVKFDADATGTDKLLQIGNTEDSLFNTYFPLGIAFRHSDNNIQFNALDKNNVNLWIGPTFSNPSSIESKTKFNHLAFTINNRTAKYYLNGELISQNTESAFEGIDIPSGNNNSWVGAEIRNGGSDITDFTDGVIDEVSIFGDKVLTQDEIRDLYRDNLGLTYDFDTRVIDPFEDIEMNIEEFKTINNVKDNFYDPDSVNIIVQNPNNSYTRLNVGDFHSTSNYDIEYTLNNRIVINSKQDQDSFDIIVESTDGNFSSSDIFKVNIIDPSKIVTRDGKTADSDGSLNLWNKIIDSVNAFIPDSDRMNDKQKLAFVLVFMLVTNLILILATTLKGSATPSTILMVLGIFDVLTFLVFTGMGYIPVGFVFLLIVIGILYLTIKYMGAFTG